MKAMARSKLSEIVPSRLFIAPSHRVALKAMWRAVNYIDRLSVLTGDKGTGKTALIGSLLKGADESFQVAYIANCTLPFADILDLIVGQIVPNRNLEIGNLQTLETLAANLSPHTRLILIFDGAETLSDQALDQIRSLAASSKPGLRFHVILVGLPELAERLLEPKYSDLSQLIGTWAELPRLQETEVRNYVRHIIHGDSRTGPRWSSGAINCVAWFSRGELGTVEMLCRESQHLAELESVPLVLARHVRLAAALNGLPKPDRQNINLRISEMLRATMYWIRCHWIPVTAAPIGCGIALVALITLSSKSEKVWSRIHTFFAGRDSTIMQPKVSSESHYGMPSAVLPSRQANPESDGFGVSRLCRLEKPLVLVRDEAPEGVTSSFSARTEGINTTSIRMKIVKVSRKRKLSKTPDTVNHTATELDDKMLSRSTGGFADKLEVDSRDSDTPQTAATSTENIDAATADLNRGDAAMADGDYPSALLNYQMALALDPTNSQIPRKIERAHRAEAAESRILQ
jgi:type II secretory pathway predicted ATPase ExeA